MTYATREDLEKRYGAAEIAQREAGLDDVTAVATALTDADALIDGYLVGRYTLPLTSIPSNLVQVAGAIARYNLLGEAATDRARIDFKDALTWLKDVEAGRVRLQSAAPLPANAPAATVQVNSSPSVFKREGRP